MNPVETIEQAELSAEKTIADANAKKIQIMKAAQEKTAENSVKALEEAEKKAESILEIARHNSDTQQQSLLQSLEKELQELRQQGEAQKPQAVSEILELLPTLL